jgi:erythromycin esterase-like protein
MAFRDRGPAGGRGRRDEAGGQLVDLVRGHARPFDGEAADDDALIDRIANARLVLIGEASHGTHEFYRERARLTERLIREHGFAAVAAEADWPDAYRINRFARGLGPDVEAIEALSGFARFPAWMWRNGDVLDFVGWLRDHNDGLPAGAVRAGFYGLDLYSLYASMEAVITYLDRADPAAAARARARYACFEQTGDDGQRYGLSAGLGLSPSCEKAVLEQLSELRRHAAEFAGGTPIAQDEFFFAEQNARVASNAERYYRSMFAEGFEGRASSWNLRDRHMMDTLEALIEHLERMTGTAKIVVWAHNSHLGDARATDMGRAGEWNLGQLVRQKYGAAAVLVGLTTFDGTVTAASSWGGPAERKTVRPALSGSYEGLFHRVGLPRFWLPLGNDRSADDDDNRFVQALHEERLERAIGVIYAPHTERASHYFYADLPAQFDLVLHIDHTRALEPLDAKVAWRGGEPPETFPSSV